jgi:protein-L-isoaspartate(D-aspartate) O-methyltransferase
MAGSGREARHEGWYERRQRVAARALRARMVRRIVAGGGLTDPAWRAAFAEVPRHLFVRDGDEDGHGGGSYGGGRYGGGPYASGSYGREGAPGTYGQEGVPGPHGPPGDGAEPPGPTVREEQRRMLRDLTAAYTDRPIATRVVGGELVSSSSQPSLMALMCQALDVADGHRVLEIGAGTGYNAALLAHRLGPGAVTTIDLEPEITDAARAHLDAYGTEAARSVAVVTGDGALGHPPRAPYDRIMATCELPSIPAAWLEQCVPGGLVLAPLAGGLLALTVHGPGRAEGRFLDTPAYFVPLRGARAGGAQGLGDRVFGGGRHPDRTRYGLTVAGGRQWVWRDDPHGPSVWPVTPAGS